MRHYFCGWYFRCQSDQQALAVIPSVHKTSKSDFCAIQLITDTQVFHVQFPYSDFQMGPNQIRVARNLFGTEGITLDIETPDFHVSGTIRFGPFTPLRYDIMGPFRYVPFMQCRHCVCSMRHSADGEITINDNRYIFQNAVGYIEGDRGHSFPRKYMWTQCSFPDGALMLSIAEIPFGPLRFTGVIGVVYLKGKEYRLATYLGARAIKISAEEIIVRQGDAYLIIKPQEHAGHPLQAPVDGAMTRMIHENPACKIYYRFEKNGTALLEWNASKAAFEYEY